jgi:hypothetical protein
MAQPDTITRTRSKDSDRRSSAETAPANPREPGGRIDPEERRRLVEYQAYLLYLERGAVPGFEIDDWLAAEHQVDGRRG